MATSRVEANRRLAALVGVLALAPLLLVEVVTLVQLGAWLGAHVFVGLWLVPPLLLKTAAALRRFLAYHLGIPDFRRAGPPEPLARLAGPPLLVATAALFASGVALWLGTGGPDWRAVHRGAFVAWFLLMAVHVLIHLPAAGRLGLDDLGRAEGGSLRAGLVAGSLLAGLALAFASVAYPGPATVPAGD